ncbi:hydroxymethylglutaryl-CoA lyase [Natribacillus halophilus]|uniref:Hydroxymethylglutaryl-CoA lyase n=1 Tax=Natribacillus halophilus TaxID=549003 RepID=A0A1G8KQN5_9BACI|nr:hydroxymethylglutaryl-CoA lyase [Natribacillus halophilus]SDI45738.1 hydroxymethylglutaryl-CoA lyase [Natribacillus halophilus]
MIELCEVGPRDGLQNEKKQVTTGDKVKFINQLIAAGVKKFETASFVNPKVVPQMADAEQVMETLPDRNDVTYAGLVLSRSGLERALSTKVDRLHVVSGTSDTFNRKNVRRTVDESVEELTAVIEDAGVAGRPSAAILSTAFGCPYEGAVDRKRVFQVAETFLDVGVQEIVLADTTGMANPQQVSETVAEFKEKFGDEVPLGLHFHNTRGLGLANVAAGYYGGVRRFDAALGGLGGCPFAPNAVGNASSEDMIHMFQEMGVRTGIDLEAMIATAKWLEGLMEKTLPGMVMKAGAAGELSEAR